MLRNNVIIHIPSLDMSSYFNSLLHIQIIIFMEPSFSCFQAFRVTCALLPACPVVFAAAMTSFDLRMEMYVGISSLQKVATVPVGARLLSRPRQ